MKLKYIFLSLVIIIIAPILWFFFLLNSANNLESQKSFIIEQGKGVNEISDNLAKADLIKNKFVFETWLWLLKSEDKVKAGIYSFPAGSSIRQLTKLILAIPENTASKFTIIEGWGRNWPEFKKVLETHDFSYDEFLGLTASAKTWREQYDFLADAPSTASLEGFLFPDTYFVDQYTDNIILLNKILINFEQKLRPELRAEIKKQNKTIFEVVTLASIIEREVPEHADKKMIADVFLKRLKNNIGLQSDATINFVTGKGLTQPSRDDLKIDSPYNTYKYRGLPPGPIANPSISSIEAVIYPTPNDYYYFLTTKEGEVIYSQTYQEHLAAKAKYLD